MDHFKYMQYAYEQAILAMNIDEVPIGSVIVYKDNIIGRGYNKRNTKKNVLYHGEIEAIYEASKFINDWRLEDCTLYVTVEPCPMCAGAIVQARIPRVVYGTENKKAGCGGSILNILQEDRFNHKVEVIKGIMEEDCSNIMKEFFKNLRKK